MALQDAAGLLAEEGPAPDRRTVSSGAVPQRRWLTTAGACVLVAAVVVVVAVAVKGVIGTMGYGRELAGEEVVAPAQATAETPSKMATMEVTTSLINPTRKMNASFPKSGASCSGVFEAEDATYSGGSVQSYSGTGFVDMVYGLDSQSYIEWTVESCAAGHHELKVTYALPSGNRPLQLKVNSIVEADSWSFPATGSWSTWGTVARDVVLSAGSNKIRISATGHSGGNIDKLTITCLENLDRCIDNEPASPATPSATSTTETATLPAETVSLLESVLSFERGPGLERLDLTRCALVGSSNVMVGSGAGEQIDAYDTVIRINRMPPGVLASDFGTRTDVLFINNMDALSEVVDMLRVGKSTPMRISCNEMDNCKTAAIVQRGDWHCDPQQMARVWGPDHSMVGCVRRNVSDVGWSFTSLRGSQPSTGFQAMLAFLPLCQELDLFGFAGRATADGHGEWSGHNLDKEHGIMDKIADREWSRLLWWRDSASWPWMQTRAAQVRKVVGKR